MADADKTDGFFAVDRRTWARVCGLGLNRAVAYLVLARGTGKSNRETAWSVMAIEHYTGISRGRAHDAVSALIEDGVVRKLREGTRPRYDLVPWHLVPGNDTRPVTDAEESVIKKVILGKEISVSQRMNMVTCPVSLGSLPNVDHSEDDPTAATTGKALVVSGVTAHTGLGEFDYEALPPDVASDARQAAERIRVLIGKQQKAIVETGLELTTMKEKLRGRFLKWIEEALDMSDKTAERYMRVASHFGTRIETVSNLQPITLYKLTERSTPAPVRAEVLALLDSGQSVTDREVHTRIAAAKNQREPTQKKVRQANAKQAAEMLAARLGSDLGRFLELAKDLSLKEILDNLAASSWDNTPQPSAGLTPLPMTSLWDAQASKRENA